MNNFKELKEIIIENYEVRRLLKTETYDDIFQLDLQAGGLAAAIRNQFCEPKRNKLLDGVNIEIAKQIHNERISKIKQAGENVGQELAERKFTEKDLVSFGEYLLSTERTNHFIEHYNKEDNISLEERLAEVYDADLKNWYDKQTRK